MIRRLASLRLVALMAIAAFLLSGCVDYDLGIQFDSPTQGTMVQHIRLAEGFRNLSSSTAQQWLKAIEKQGRTVGGQVKRLPNQELLITIPFTNGVDLETKFNQFFHPTGKNNPLAAQFADLPAIASHLKLSRSNFLLIERNRLQFDLDLRGLGISSANGVVISTSGLFDLEFSLSAPWGIRSRTAPDLRLPSRRAGKSVWTVVSGEDNHIDAVFWLPSPLGIGSVIILLLAVGGSLLKQTLRSGTMALSRSTQPQPDSTP